MTIAQADRLAVSRFLLYQSGGSRVQASLPSAQGALTLVADVDYRSHIGYGVIAGDGSHFLLEWNADTFLAWPDHDTSTTAPVQLPVSSPARRALAPTRVAADALLALLLKLGATRPDNAQLLRQDGATWLRSTKVGATGVDVIAGPRAAGGAVSDGQNLQYYVDSRGNLLRLVARLGGATAAPTSVDLAPSQFRAVPASPRLTG